MAVTLNGGPRSVLRVMDIVQILALNSEGLSLTKLSEALDVPKTSLFTILKALASAGYIRSQAGVYVLGNASLKLGAAINRARHFPECARETLQWLTETTGETVIIGVLEQASRGVLYIDVIEANQPLRFSVRPGDIQPLYSSAIGQTLLAFQDNAFRKEYLSKTKFAKFTTDTLSSQGLAQHLKGIRRSAVTYNVNGRIDGVIGIASPIFDSKSEIHSAICVGAPSARIKINEKKIRKNVLIAAEEISRILGYPGKYPPKFAD